MLKEAATIVLLLAALLYVGDQDYQQEVADARFYCEQVQAGVWPNYENRECGE